MENTLHNHEVIIRVLSIELKNFKNVEQGKIKLPHAFFGDPFSSGAEILGIYGQNGSGKTAVIEAFNIIRICMSGRSLPTNTKDLIFNLSETATIKCSFSIKFFHSKYLVDYEVVVSRHVETKEGLKSELSNDNDSEMDADSISVEKEFCIKEEKLSMKQLIEGTQTRMTPYIFYKMYTKKPTFSPEARWKKMCSNSIENIGRLLSSQETSISEAKSFIFGTAHNLLVMPIPGEPLENRIILQALKIYAWGQMNILHNIQVTKSTIPFYYVSNLEGFCIRKFFRMPTNSSTVLDEEEMKSIEEILKPINIVLDSIIPGIQIEVGKYGSRRKGNGIIGESCELLSIRGENRIPLRSESDGIKKIISILGVLISTYNDPSAFTAVDELDAGIFEYLLGEILTVFEKGGEGQLIFTSHNLRPLEMLKQEDIIFTTTNSHNRFIRFVGLKQTNNLRDQYFRSINIGGQEENIYMSTNSYEIAYALEKANDCIMGDRDGN